MRRGRWVLVADTGSQVRIAVLNANAVRLNYTETAFI